MIPAPSCQVSPSLQVFPAEASAKLKQKQAVPSTPHPNSWPESPWAQNGGVISLNCGDVCYTAIDNWCTQVAWLQSHCPILHPISTGPAYILVWSTPIPLNPISLSLVKSNYLLIPKFSHHSALAHAVPSTRSVVPHPSSLIHTPSIWVSTKF